MRWDRIFIYGSVGAAFGLIVIFNLFLWFAPQWDPPNQRGQMPPPSSKQATR